MTTLEQIGVRQDPRSAGTADRREGSSARYLESATGDSSSKAASLAGPTAACPAGVVVGGRGSSTVGSTRARGQERRRCSLASSAPPPPSSPPPRLARRASQRETESIGRYEEYVSILLYAHILVLKRSSHDGMSGCCCAAEL